MRTRVVTLPAAPGDEAPRAGSGRSASGIMEQLCIDIRLLYALRAAHYTRHLVERQVSS